MKKENYLLTVLGKDCCGIIAKVTYVLSAAGCNLEDVAMTLLEGEFAMMVVISIPHEKIRMKVIQKLENLEKKERLTFFWKKLSGKLKHGEIHARGTRNCLITAMGRDQVGIVYQISSLLAKHHLNITTLNSRLLRPSGSAVYSMMLEIDMPKTFPVSRLLSGLKRIQKRLGVEIRFKEAEILEM